MNRRQRHLGRELALQWVFQVDVGHVPADTVTETLPDQMEEWLEREDAHHLNAEGIAFARELVRGVRAEKEGIDTLILTYAKDWPLERMAAVERNILRIALYEILHMPDIPPAVSIDEAVEVAKRYGTEDSGKFVNGILGAQQRGQVEKPKRAPKPPKDETPEPNEE
jgi:transcription antitermination factor NusB